MKVKKNISPRLRSNCRLLRNSAKVSVESILDEENGGLNNMLALELNCRIDGSSRQLAAWVPWPMIESP